ncbi:MAG: hypothetical protein KGZ82_03375 [Bacteroidales bacterium]|nr:hypothetical protein [Bacteroidales bacterium]
MDQHNNQWITGIFVLITIVLLSACSSSKWSVPENLVGQWKSQSTKITVRTEPQWMKFQFIADTVEISFTIDSNKEVSGSIGQARFATGQLRRNKGNPAVTGVAYIIECGNIGKIFDDDPLENKEVELWLGPSGNYIEAELRFTEGWAVFPMGNLLLRKITN